MNDAKTIVFAYTTLADVISSSQFCTDAGVAAAPLLTRTTPDLVSSFLHSEEYQTLMDSVQPMVEATSAGSESAVSEQQPSLTYATSFFWQVSTRGMHGSNYVSPLKFYFYISITFAFFILSFFTFQFTVLCTKSLENVIRDPTAHILRVRLVM